MQKTHVEIAEVQKLATEVRRAQSSLDAGVKGFSEASFLTPQSVTVHQTPLVEYNLPLSSPMGNTSAGSTCVTAHNQAMSMMGTVLKAFAATIDSDAERLTLALALYQNTDDEVADELLKANRNRLDIFSTQLTNYNQEWAQDQAAELNTLRTLAGDQFRGNTVVAGDFNAASTNHPSAPYIQQFGDQGFDVHAGDIHDGPGGSLVGTSLKHHPIDHVMPRGMGSAPAQRWDRGQSDHDGQIVDLTMPNW